MITRAEAREGPKYQVSYRVNDQVTISKAFTKEQNDDFAKAMELMGVTDIIKSFYNPAMREWFRYHNDKEIQEANQAAREINPSLDE